MLSDTTLGVLVSAMGYEPAQVVTRLLSVATYALVLPALCRVFELSALDAALALMTMAVIGHQDIVGGEWLFGAYEAKVAAYVLVLAALRLVLISERLTAATLLFAAATYLHFLVGGFWFIAAMALRLLHAPRNLRKAAASLVFVLCGAAVCGLPGATGDSAAQATDAAARRDLFIIREPHHQSPFPTWYAVNIGCPAISSCDAGLRLGSLEQ
jgi:hypothetical protein